MGKATTKAPVKESKAAKTTVNFVATPKRPLNRRGNEMKSVANKPGKPLLDRVKHNVKRNHPRLYTLGQMVMVGLIIGLSVTCFFLAVWVAWFASL